MIPTVDIGLLVLSMFLSLYVHWDMKFLGEDKEVP